MDRPFNLNIRYEELLERYGPQGWWPLLELRDSKEKPSKSGSQNGYHPGDYAWPKTGAQRFEICVGAILTQNTTWTNAEKALLRLNEADLLNARAIASSEAATIAEAINCAGYFNQKARKLHIFAEFWQNLENRIPTRDELLSLWGIGPETADSMLLYAFSQPLFVVDAYTRRLLGSHISAKATYTEIQNLFMKELPQDVALYQEYHALIVEEAKQQKKAASPCV